MEGLAIIDASTRVLCLIGKPVRHSLSPVMHNAAIRALNLNFVYVAFEVEPQDLGKAVEGIRSLGIGGANVTMPHKIEVVKYLDEVSEDARKIGAVNTIVNEGGTLKGYNTDGVGALKSLEMFTDVDGKKVVLLGAGGAARAIAYTLSGRVSELAILNRTEEKAVNLARNLANNGSTVRGMRLSVRNLENELRDADILINATSVGMESNESLVPEHLLRPGLVVFDIVYRPLHTKLLRDAMKAGCTTIDGLWMLVLQGAESFKLWTGHYPDIRIMRNAALKALGVEENEGEG